MSVIAMVTTAMSMNIDVPVTIARHALSRSEEIA